MGNFLFCLPVGGCYRWVGTAWYVTDLSTTHYLPLPQYCFIMTIPELTITPNTKPPANFPPKTDKPRPDVCGTTKTSPRKAQYFSCLSKAVVWCMLVKSSIYFCSTFLLLSSFSFPFSAASMRLKMRSSESCKAFACLCPQEQILVSSSSEGSPRAPFNVHRK